MSVTSIARAVAEDPVTAARAGATLAVAPALDGAIDAGREALLALQNPAGDWCFEFEADCTIPAEYILMMHFMDEIDEALQARLARYLRAQQVVESHGGWPQYRGGALDLSCTVKTYYALKCAGDDIHAPHMRLARDAILAAGGAARSNVFTRILLAMFQQVPWTAAPHVPVEIMLFPRWFPFEIYKVSSWARAVMVPLFVLCSLKARAQNPHSVQIAELFVRPASEETDWFPAQGAIGKLFLLIDKIGRFTDPFIPKRMRQLAIRRAEAWFVPRLNGEYGLNGIFPAMVNAYEALALLGYPPEHPLRAGCLKSLQNLIVELPDGSAYAQPTVSPTWDTGWAMMALLHAHPGDDAADGSSRARTKEALRRAEDWLLPRQILDHVGDWIESAPKPAPRPGGWAFQAENKYFPDLDDTAAIAGVLHLVGRDGVGGNRHAECTARAAEWLLGLQSKNGGFGAYDADNTHHWINSIPFADHKAMLDPPTEDVTGRVLAYLGVLKRAQDRPAIARAVGYLKKTQQADGCWWGRWGTNYIYGTWSALAGLALVGEDLRAPYIVKAVEWLRAVQNPDGGWGETNDSYLDPALRGRMVDTTNGSGGYLSTPNSTAWALLGLLAVGEAQSETVRRGIDWLLANQCAHGKYGGLWHDAGHNAPGFPRVFYMKYYGYDAYFPLWALTRYRQLAASSAA
ncbi:MAG: squalene-hopene cyclase [Nevskia sp.]|nr:squalene-hopene cyclase [Nevskia sp.]